jgi:HlyD family secretion protein
MTELDEKSPLDDASTDRLIRIFQSETGEIRERRPPWQARATVLSLSTLLVSLIGISNFMPIDRVVTSIHGQIVTVLPNIVLQPLDLSIIKSIDVQEGDRIKRGQIIASLDPTIASADVLTLQTQIESLDAEIARCVAELAGRPYAFSQGDRHSAVDYAAIQGELYRQRKLQFDSQTQAYDAQIAVAHATVVKLTDDLQRTEQRSVIAQDIEKMWSALRQKDSSSELQLLTARDTTLQQIKAEENDRDAIAETEHQIEATTASREAFIQQWKAQTSQEMVLARTTRDAQNEQLEKALKHKQLIRLEAPDDAIVLRIEKRSVGSVLAPGEPFAELALLSSPMEAEILIDPRDIGFVRAGDSAAIKLDPYNFVEHGYAEGTLRWVSQGTFTELQAGTAGAGNSSGTSATGGAPTTLDAAGNGLPYYKGRIAITKTDLKNVPDDFRLLPGTTLTADIHVGVRSAFLYLVTGLVRGYSEAMREP